MNAKIILAAAAMLALAGCAGADLKKAETMTPEGTEFDNALSAGYLRLAKAEYAEADYTDADYFAKRSITTGSALIVLPPEVTTRKLPEGDAIYVLAAREELVEVLDGGARIVVPKQAAAAQVAYECWIQELEENLQPDHIDACRDELDGLIPELRNAIADKEVAAAPPPKPMPKPMPKLPKGKSYKVYFPTGGSKLDAKANETISAAVAHAASYDPPRVIVAGYTDTVGSADSNDVLSMKRARVVAAAIRIRGVSRDAIKAQGYGQQFPNMRTADGVAEPKNRRVEIQVAP
jgi:outer membrane protein OmpA-like peptidoglycan-associated protein